MFSAIAEELGSIFGICLLLVCMSCFIMFINISMQLTNRFYRLVAVGLGTTYAVQVFLTVGGGIKLIPMTGVTLPLVSYGGSSMLSTQIMFAIVQGLYMLQRDEEIKNAEKNMPSGYEQEPYGPEGYGQGAYPENGYGPEGYGPGDYGQDPYGNDGYGRDAYGQDDYGPGPYTEDGYGEDPYMDAGYGQEPFNEQDGYAGTEYGGYSGYDGTKYDYYKEDSEEEYEAYRRDEEDPYW